MIKVKVKALEKKNSGFTLVELLVSVAIFTIITTVAIFNHNRFNGSVLLTNLAYEIALSVRQAQFYGIAVRQNDSGSFTSGYGVYFDLNNDINNPVNRIKYILFQDNNSNEFYDANDMILQVYHIQKGNYISKICINDNDCTRTKISFAFKRPNPEAEIMYESSQGSIAGPVSKAEICLASPQGTFRKIIIEGTGQISVAQNTDICVEN